jgi:ribosomal protein S6
VAIDKDDDMAEKQILAIITRERERGKWRRINYVLGKQRAGACFKVQLEQNDGTIAEFSSKEEVQNAIWENIHLKRF